MNGTSSALERIIIPSRGTLARDAARGILEMRFTESDVKRYRRLSVKAQKGTLTPAESLVLDDLLVTNDVLLLLHAKARASLDKRSPAA